MTEHARSWLIPGLLLALLASGGCVRRTISITSEPEGAMVWLNDREVGRTPLEIDFLYYGEYDVRVDAEGYEPLLTSANTELPWWDVAPLDLGAEVVPASLDSRTAWHFVLEPSQQDPWGLLQRARETRDAVEALAPPDEESVPALEPEPDEPDAEDFDR